MLFKLEFLSIFFVVEKTKAFGENNSKRINISSSLNQLKAKFGCIPPDSWNIMRLKNYAGAVVCSPSDYESNNEPNNMTLHPIVMDVKESTIIDIDETQKTMTMQIDLIFVWYDERIKAVFPGNRGFAKLIYYRITEQKPKFWDPFLTLLIAKQKNRRYMLDPIIVKMGLMGIKTVNEYLSSYNSTTSFSSDLTSVVTSEIKWELTVACPFDYSDFPFDAHKCPLEITLPYGGNLTFFNKQKRVMKYLNGFEIVSHDLCPFTGMNAVENVHNTTFGFVVSAKRQISSYVYQYYAPSVTIVIAASLSFVIPLPAIPGRVSLVVTLFLTLTNIFIHHMVRP